MSIKDEPKVKSLYKAIKLLDYFDEKNPERGVTELAQLSGNIKSSVHNIMQTFEQCGIVYKNAATNKYRLGHKVVELGNLYYSNNNVLEVASRVLQEVNAQVDETVYFAAIADREVMYIDVQYKKGITNSGKVMGFKAPLYCTGIGKAMMAHLGEEEIDAIIGEGLESFTPYTLTEPDALKKDLNAIVTRGYAIDNMEHEYGIRCVAVPILDSNQRPVFAMSISGPSLRMPDEMIEQYGKILMDKTTAIARVL